MMCKRDKWCVVVVVVVVVGTNCRPPLPTTDDGSNII